MDETQSIYKWKNIEIFGVEVPDFAAHSMGIYQPLFYGHLMILLIFTLALLWVLYRYGQLGQHCFENKKFYNIFTYVLTPSAILSCLSGAYLYFISSVVFNADPNLALRALVYVVLAALYFISVIYIFKAPPPKKTRVLTLSFAIVISSVALFSSYFGVIYD